MGDMPRRTTDAALPAPVDTPARPVHDVELRAGRARDERLTSWLLRAGLVFVLSYAATASVIHPETFVEYFPSFVPAAWVDGLLPVFAMFEALLAVGLLTHRYACMASMLAGITMVAIIAVNPHAFEVLFRNVAIACGAFALAVQCRRERGSPSRVA